MPEDIIGIDADGVVLSLKSETFRKHLLPATS